MVTLTLSEALGLIFFKKDFIAETKAVKILKKLGG